MQKKVGSAKAVLTDALVSGYFIASFIYSITNKYSFTDSGFSTGTPLTTFILIYAISAAVIAGYGSIVPAAACLSLPITAIIYSSYMSLVSGSFYVALASGCICSLTVYICIRQMRQIREQNISPNNGRGRLTAVILACAAIIFVGYTFACSVLKYNSYFPDITQAKYAQMMYIIGHTGIQASTLESSAGNLLVHFSVHISPVLYLLFPIFKLLPSVLTLSFINSLIVSLSVIPMYFLCRRHKLSQLQTICMSSLVLIYPAVFTSVSGGFSELCFMLPLLLCVLLFTESKKYVLAAIFSLLTLTVHETAAIYLIFIGLYFLSVSSKNSDAKERKKSRIYALSLLSFSFVYLAVCLILLSNSNVGLNLASYFYNLGSDASLYDVIKNIITNPTSVISTSFNSNKLNFIVILALSALPVFLLRKRVSTIILVCPTVLLNLLSVGSSNSSILFPTATACASVILYIAVLALEEYANSTEGETHNEAAVKTASVCLIFAMVFSCMFNMFQIPTTFGEAVMYMTEHKSDTDKISEALSKIPDNAILSASDTLLPHLSQRPQLYRLTSEKETAYVIIDLRSDIISSAEQKYNTEYYENKGYKIYIYSEDIIAVMVKPDV